MADASGGGLYQAPPVCVRATARTGRRRLVFALVVITASAGHAAASGWVSPTGFQDPANDWRNEPNAYDDNTGTYAEDTSHVRGYGSWLVLTLSTPITCGRIRVNADYWTVAVDGVDIDVYRDGAWVNVWDGAIPDCQWDEKTFAAGTVTSARFRYHYVRNNYTFWFYEFDFYEEAASIEPPTCETLAATSVEETTAILHGGLVSDGGDPCQFRFQYGLTAAYGTDTPWEGGKVTGDPLAKLITGLQSGTTYHFRVQAMNSAGTGAGLDRTFAAGPPATGWVSPSGHTDPDNAWDDETSAYDDELASYARCYHDINDPVWGPYLYLTHTPMACDRIRFYARAAGDVDSVNVDVFRNGAWVDVYQGAFADKQWVEYSFTEGTVTQARIQFHVKSANLGLYWELYEFAFRRVMNVAISGACNGVTRVTLAVNGAVRGSYTGPSPYSFATPTAAGDRLLIYYDNNVAGTDGAVVTTATGGSLTGLDLAVNSLVLRSDGGTLTRSALAAAHPADTDVPFTVSGTTVTVAAGVSVTVPASQSFNLDSGSLVAPQGIAIGGTVALSPSTTLALGAGAVPGSVAVAGGGTLSATGTPSPIVIGQGTAGFAFTVASGGTLDVASLTVNHTGTAGLNVADGAVIAKLDAVSFRGGTGSTTYLALGLLSGNYMFTACDFDANCQYNVSAPAGGSLAVIMQNATGTKGASPAGEANDNDPSDRVTWNYGKAWTGNAGTSWATAASWSDGIVPDSTSDVVVPDRPNDPVLTADASARTVNVTNGTLGLASYTLNVYGNLAFGAAGALNAGTGRVAFRGGADQTVSAPGVAFANFSVDKTGGTLAATSALDVNGAFDLAATNAGTFSAGNYGHALGGDLTVSAGTFAPGAGTLTFDGATNAAIGGAGGLTLNDVVINKSAGDITVTAQRSLDINGSLQIVQGTLVGGAFTHYLAGNWICNGSFNAAGSTVVLDGAAAQIVSAPETFYNLTVRNALVTATFPAGGASLTVDGELVVEPATELTLSGGAGGKRLVVNGCLTSVGTSLAPGEECRIEGAGPGFTAEFNNDVSLEFTVMAGLALDPATSAGVLLGGGASSSVHIQNVVFQGLANPGGYYLHATGAAWDGTTIYEVAFEDVDGDPLTENGTGTVSVNGVNVAVSHYVQSADWSAGDTTDRELGGGTVTWLPLAVGLMWTEAATTPAGVEVRWRTRFEFGTAGFEVQRAGGAPGAWRTIPGGFVRSKGPRGGTYEVLDAGAEGEAAYRLVEIDTHRQSHELAIIVPAGAGADPVRTFAAPPTVPDVSRFVAERPPVSLARKAPAGDGKARKSAAAKVEIAEDPAIEFRALAWRPWLTSAAPKAKLRIPADGIYELAAAEIAALGLDAEGPLYLTHRGLAQPLAVVLGPLDEVVAVRFNAHGYETTYTGENVYWLGAEPVATGAVSPGALDDYEADVAYLYAPPVTGLTQGPVSSHLATARAEADEYYAPEAAGGGGGATWYYTDPLSTAAPTQVDVTLSAPDAAADFTLRVAVRGTTADGAVVPDHHIDVSVAGTYVGEIRFDGMAYVEQAFAVPGGTVALADGVNAVALATPGDTGALFEEALLDFVEIAYSRPLAAVGDRLTFVANVGLGNAVSVAGFSSDDVTAFDVTDAAAVALAVATSGAGTYSAEATAVADGERRYAFAAAGALGSPAATSRGAVRDLFDTHAEYLAVAPGALAASVTPLIDAHERRGLATDLADLEDVYDLFGFGLAEPAALEAMAAALAPRFLVLAGSTTYDFHDREGGGLRNLLPCFLTSDGIQEIPTDAPLEAPAGGERVIAVGRFPAASAAELDAMVAKAVAALHAPADPARVALFSADDDDPRFKSASDEMSAGISIVAVEKAYLSDEDITVARAKVAAALDDGAALVSFFGHGSDDVWAAESLLSTADVPGLADTARPGLVLQLSCLSGYFASPYARSLGEALVLEPDAGAAATVAPTGLVPPEGQVLLGRAFVAALRAGETVGEALVAAKRQAEVSYPLVAKGFVLLGDPAFRLPFNPDDLDGDGLPGSWEARNGLSDADPIDAEADPDCDGLTSAQEYALGWDPMVAGKGGDESGCSPSGDGGPAAGGTPASALVIAAMLTLAGAFHRRRRQAEARVRR